MAITNRDLPVGTRLVADYKKAHYVCVVEAGEDGKKAFVLEDGKRYKSPSSAASAVMGGSAANGWKFWSLEGATPAANAAQSAPKGRKTDGTRIRAAEAPQPPAGDYLINGDGRPLNEGETPAAVEGEEQSDADRA